MKFPSRKPPVLDRFSVLAVLRGVLGVGMLALVGMVLTILIVAAVQLRTRNWILHSREVLHISRDANEMVLQRAASVRGFLVAGDSTTLAPDVSLRTSLPRLLDSLVVETADSRPEQDKARAFRSAVSTWDNAFVTPALAAAARGDVGAARALAAQNDHHLFDQVRTTYRSFLDTEAALYHARDRHMVVVRWVTALVLLSEIIVLLLAMIRTRKRLLAQAGELVQQQDLLEQQKTLLEEQASELEQQMQELQTLTGDLETSNQELGEALHATRRTTEALRERDEALRRSTSELRALFSAAPLAICMIDLDGVVRSWNPAAVKMFGWAEDEAVGQPLQALPGDLTVLRDAAERQGALTDISGQGKRKDGSVVEVSMSCGAMRDDRGTRGYVITFADMTDRKRLEEQLIQAQKMEAVGRLAGGVAHDFNNMLTAIKSYSQLLLQDVSADDAKHKDIREIDQAADRAARLTRQLLAFSRQQMLQPRLLDINQTVAELEKMLQRLLLKDISLVTVLEPDLHLVRADAGQIEQVIVNLVVNARDAMPEGGQLTIRTSNVELDAGTARERWPMPVRTGTYVLITVTDTGQGMNDATKSRIFEPFFTTKERHKGTGLGLSTVYGIIKQSGGYIRVDSAPGSGTTFEIYLPMADAASTPARKSTRATAARSGAETVLVVEDDDGIRAVIKRILERAGHRVIEATNGVEALKVCESAGDTIDLVLSDIAMPEMQGPDLARRIHERHPKIAMLLMSGYTDAASQQADFLGPGVDFLGKPFSPDALTQKVRHILDGAA